MVMVENAGTTFYDQGDKPKTERATGYQEPIEIPEPPRRRFGSARHIGAIALPVLAVTSLAGGGVWFYKHLQAESNKHANANFGTRMEDYGFTLGSTESPKFGDVVPHNRAKQIDVSCDESPAHNVGFNVENNGKGNISFTLPGIAAEDLHGHPIEAAPKHIYPVGNTEQVQDFLQHKLPEICKFVVASLENKN